MFLVTAREKEHLPWYRMKSYDGNLTEAQKRHLDQIRMRDRHPAASFSDLPEEVQSYVSGLEMTIYDAKQEKAVAKAFIFSAMGAALIYSGFKGTAYLPWPSIIFGFVVLVGAWPLYGREWKKNAEEFLPKDDSAPTHTDELLRREWELGEIANLVNQRKSDEAVGASQNESSH
jgi:hypothetical protein